MTGGDKLKGRLGVFFNGDPTLIPYYQLNGSSFDDSFNAFGGTDNSVIYGSKFGKFGQGASFNGSTSYITQAISSGFSNSFSFSVWVNLNSLPATTSVYPIELYPGGSSTLSFWASLQILASGSGVFALYDGTNNPTVTGGSVLPGAWHHLVGVRDTVSNNIFLYIDGSLIGSATDNTTPPSYTTLHIGVHELNGSPQSTTYINGSIEEVGMFQRALSSGEIASYYRWAISGKSKRLIDLLPSPIAVINYGASLLAQLVTQ